MPTLLPKSGSSTQIKKGCQSHGYKKSVAIGLTTTSRDDSFQYACQSQTRASGRCSAHIETCSAALELWDVPHERQTLPDAVKRRCDSLQIALCKHCLHLHEVRAQLRRLLQYTSDRMDQQVSTQELNTT